jgi:flagellar motor switch protein FliN/FliY
MADSFLSPEEIEALLKDNPPVGQQAEENNEKRLIPTSGLEGGSAEASPIDSEPMALSSQNLGLILDIPLKLTVLLGRTKRNIADVLKLNKGSIVELDRLENEPVDILVNDTLIARGEVVVVREYFGVRITDIISTEKRLKSLVSS